MEQYGSERKMICFLCKKKITPGTEKEYISVTPMRERQVHPGCKENAKENARKSKKGVSA